jgi:hypothetical protein
MQWYYHAMLTTINYIVKFEPEPNFPLYIAVFPLLNLGYVVFNKSGKADFRKGWKITYEKGVKWITDVFDYHWNKALPIPNEIIKS